MKFDSVFATDLGKLYSGDCEQIMRKLPSESVDLFFADPPFNLNKTYGNDNKDNLPEQEYLKWCYRWIDEGIRLLKPGGAFYLYNIPKWNIYLAEHLSKRLTFRHWITIKLTFSLPIQGRLYPAHYSLLYFVKGNKPKTFTPPRQPIQVCRHCGGEIQDYGGYKNKMNPKGVNLSDIWIDIPPVRHSKYKKRKENALSLKLLDRVLDISSKEGDMVLDPFGGSGTTYIASELKGRNWIGMEIATADKIVERFQNIEEDKKYFDYLQRNKNVLFTEDAIKLRKHNGHNNLKYSPHECEQLPQLPLISSFAS